MPSKAKVPDIVHPDVTGMWHQHMPAYSDMCPVCGPAIAARKVRADRVKAIHRSLVDFGYSGLTLDDAGAAYDIAIVRKPTAADVIIAMMTRSQLRDAGLVSDD